MDQLLKDLLLKMERSKASDLYLVAESAPVMKIDGHLVSIGTKLLSAEECRQLVYQMLSPEMIEKFERKKELDYSFALSGVSRFRCNTHYQKGSVAAAFRAVPEEIPARQDLGLPKVIEEFALEPYGLVLLTGPTGCGKSTTLAVMIDIINNQRDCHIVTIEDPIEFIHHHHRSTIEQREVGQDTLSFNEALRRVLRMAPDVILLGEMRDLESIATAVTAAETGHLVLSTLHTNDAVQAIDRIIDVFPPGQQEQIRMQLSMALKGVVAQRLLPRADSRGRVVATEILKVTPAVSNCIRKGKTHEVYSLLEIGSEQGMKTMEASLKELVQSGQIDVQEAARLVRNPAAFGDLLGRDIQHR